MLLGQVEDYLHPINPFIGINPNKAGLFEGSFFLGGGRQFDPSPFILQEELILYAIVKQSI